MADTGLFEQEGLTGVPHLRDKDRLTLRDGTPRRDLQHIAEHTTRYGGPSERRSITTDCEVYPIVPDHWTPADPVAVWRIGDIEHSPALYTWNELVFHPTSPDDLCQQALARARARYHLKDAADPTYLEGKWNESADAGMNKLAGLVSLAFMSGLWILVALYYGLRDWWRSRRR